MTYAQGGTIEASDYNNFLGAASGTTGGNIQFNPVWATGLGSYGWGQTALSNVSIGGTVSASEWAALINNLNNAKRHLTLGFSNTGMAPPTAGNTITYLSPMAGNITYVAENRLNGKRSSDLYSLKSVRLTAAAGVAATATYSWTVTFASVDQARYFFNAGGLFRVDFFSSVNHNGTARSASLITLAQTDFGAKAVRAEYWTPSDGGGDVIIDLVGQNGYYGIPSTSTTYCRINSTSFYTGDYIQLDCYQSGGTGSYGGNGNSINFTITLYSSTVGASGSNDDLDVTVEMNLAIGFPSTDYISNSWGTVTIT